MTGPAPGPAPHDYRTGPTVPICTDCGLPYLARCHWNAGVRHNRPLPDPDVPAGTPAGQEHTEGNTMTTNQGDAETIADLAAVNALLAPVHDADPEQFDGPSAELLRRTGEAVAVLTQQVDDLTKTNAELTERLASEKAIRESVEQSCRFERSNHATFQSDVRDVAIRVAEEQGWCTEGLNEVLEELGLDPKETEWMVTVKITVAPIIREVKITAASEAAAREQAETNEDDVVSNTVEFGDFDDEYDIDVEGSEPV